MNKKIEIIVNRKDKEERITAEYIYGDIVYYAFTKHKKWCVRKSMVDSIVFTNMINYQLDNGVCLNNTDRLFDNEDDAVRFCLDKNEKSKVKIYNRNSWVY